MRNRALQKNMKFTYSSDFLRSLESLPGIYKDLAKGFCDYIREMFSDRMNINDARIAIKRLFKNQDFWVAQKLIEQIFNRTTSNRILSANNVQLDAELNILLEIKKEYINFLDVECLLEEIRVTPYNLPIQSGTPLNREIVKLVTKDQVLNQCLDRERNVSLKEITNIIIGTPYHRLPIKSGALFSGIIGRLRKEYYNGGFFMEEWTGSQCSRKIVSFIDKSDKVYYNVVPQARFYHPYDACYSIEETEGEEIREELKKFSDIKFVIIYTCRFDGVSKEIYNNRELMIMEVI